MAKVKVDKSLGARGVLVYFFLLGFKAIKSFPSVVIVKFFQLKMKKKRNR
jgi:hypothetical protein